MTNPGRFSPRDPADDYRTAREWSVEQGRRDREEALLGERPRPGDSRLSMPVPDADADDPLSAFHSEKELVRRSAPDLVRETATRLRARPQERSLQPPWRTWRRSALHLLDQRFGTTFSRTPRALILSISGLLGLAGAAFVFVPAPPPTGWVMIASTPAGAPVSIDGVLRGPTRFGGSLPAGKHQVDVGRDPVVRSQTFYVTAGGDTAVHVELPQPGPAKLETGGLAITRQPRNARVWIDGKEHGRSPLTVNELTPGLHNVLVTTPAGSMTRQVTVEQGTVSSPLLMSITSVGGFASGWLTVSSPVVAEIREGGTLLGSTNTPRFLIPAGEHHIEISNPAFGYRVARTIQIRPGQTQTITLEVPQGILHVNALPWAEVWIDGQRMGETPIGNISLPIGTHELVLRNPAFGERRQQVAVGLDGPTRVGVSFRK